MLHGACLPACLGPGARAGAAPARCVPPSVDAARSRHPGEDGGGQAEEADAVRLVPAGGGQGQRGRGSHVCDAGRAAKRRASEQDIAAQPANMPLPTLGCWAASSSPLHPLPPAPRAAHRMMGSRSRALASARRLTVARPPGPLNVFCAHLRDVKTSYCLRGDVREGCGTEGGVARRRACVQLLQCACLSAALQLRGMAPVAAPPTQPGVLGQWPAFRNHTCHVHTPPPHTHQTHPT